MARLDRLAPVREVAQVGAVIGREFSHALLAAVTGLDEALLRDAVDQLVGAELIFRRGSQAEPSYVFTRIPQMEWRSVSTAHGFQRKDQALTVDQVAES